MTDIEQALAAVEAIENLTDRQAIYNEAGKLRQHLQAIARQAAIGAAVESLPRTMWLGLTPDGWCVLTDDDTDEGKPHHAPSILAAITAALGENE